MNISESLRSLIESSKIDGKLSEKEKEVIINKAENEGHNRDEFEIYLDGQFQLIKSESVFKKIFKWIFKNKKTSSIIFVGLLFSVFIFSYQTTAEKRGCENVDDCIAKNKFDEAKLYNHDASQRTTWNVIFGGGWNHDKDENNKKIIKSQVNYFIINKACQQAYVLIADYNFAYGENHVHYQYNLEANWFNELLEELITECENNRELLQKAINLYRSVKVLDKKASKTSTYDVYKLDDSRKKELMKKYKLD